MDALWEQTEIVWTLAKGGTSWKIEKDIYIYTYIHIIASIVAQDLGTVESE